MTQEIPDWIASMDTIGLRQFIAETGNLLTAAENRKDDGARQILVHQMMLAWRAQDSHN